jgi:hypothetical protein
LNAAFIILKLRENIVANKWDQVRLLLTSSFDMGLPATAVEELNAGF